MNSITTKSVFVDQRGGLPTQRVQVTEVKRVEGDTATRYVQVGNKVVCAQFFKLIDDVLVVAQGKPALRIDLVQGQFVGRAMNVKRVPVRADTAPQAFQKAVQHFWR